MRLPHRESGGREVKIQKIDENRRYLENEIENQNSVWTKNSAYNTLQFDMKVVAERFLADHENYLSANFKFSDFRHFTARVQHACAKNYFFEKFICLRVG